MTGMNHVETGSPFWQFSLRYYRQPGVAAACLVLQDEAGIDVNLLLFLMWQASQLRAWSAPEIAAVEDRIRPWRDMTVIPLRRLRRALKSPPALVEPGAAEGYRTRIKAVELEAERLQQEAMAQLAEGAGGTAAGSIAEAARHNLRAYETVVAAKLLPGTEAILVDALGMSG